MKMVPCNSRAIAALGYEANVLVVAFRNGGTYQYTGVPLSVAQAFANAPSKGRYYQSFIQGHYPSVRIR